MRRLYLAKQNLSKKSNRRNNNEEGFHIHIISFSFTSFELCASSRHLDFHCRIVEDHLKEVTNKALFIMLRLPAAHGRSLLGRAVETAGCCRKARPASFLRSKIPQCALGSSLVHSFSSYSSFREPGSLFEATTPDVSPLRGNDGHLSFSEPQAAKDRDAPLRADVRTMGRLLGQIIQDHHGSETFDKIETLRGLAKAWRDAGAGRDPNRTSEADDAFDKLATYCSNLDDKEVLVIARAFTHFLAIANAAEGHHRVRLLNSTRSSEYALPDKSDSCGGVLKSLLKDHSAETIYDALTSQKVELVLTAHPTEVNRRTILEKQRRVQEVWNILCFFKRDRNMRYQLLRF